MRATLLAAKEFLLNLLKGPVTRKYPFEKPRFERSRGSIIFIREKCDWCKLCEEKCPVGAIRIEDENLEIDLKKCIYCGHCESVCGKGAIKFSSDYKPVL